MGSRSWLGGLIRLLETNHKLQRRAFLLAERARTKDATRQASQACLLRPQLRRRVMPANRLDHGTGREM